MILVIGAKGGVGTTRAAVEIARADRVVAVDLADGQFAARMERTSWLLSVLGYASAIEQRYLIEEAVQQQRSLIWNETCKLVSNKIWPVIGAINLRRPVVIDGGLEPPVEVKDWAQQVVIVTAESDLARWHTERLKRTYPQAIVINGAQKSEARALALQLFQKT